MSDPIVCPVCETPNPRDNSHCEVCGERLHPAEPGEEVGPEENVSAMIEDQPPQHGEPVSEEAIGEAVVTEGEAEEVLEMEPAEEIELEPAAEEMPIELSDEEPRVLYSPIDGTAYPEGSLEFEEGFGPQGEELVPQKPIPEETSADALDQAPIGEDEFEAELQEGEPTGAAFDNEYDEFDEDPADIAAEGAFAETEGEVEAVPEDDGTSEQFRELFKARQSRTAGAEPLPQPGVHAEPAVLTVYKDRQPVHTHPIETDETLIGRRDPVADAYPDLDLTEIDDDSVISRKHAYIFRQNKNYTLYVVSNAGTQVNADLLELGERRALEDGDVIVLAGSIAMKFELPES